jgi:hypothetical protein
MPAIAPTTVPMTDKSPKLLWPNKLGRNPPAVEPAVMHNQSTFRSIPSVIGLAPPVFIPRLGHERLCAMDRWEEGFDAWTPSAEAVDGGTNRDRQELLRLARDLAAARRDELEPSLVELEPLKRTLREAAEAVAAQGRELGELQRRLEAELAAAQAERELAVAERERLEERQQAVHEVEKELAGLRVALEAREAALAAREPADDDGAAAAGEPSERPSFSEGLAELARARARTPS